MSDLLKDLDLSRCNGCDGCGLRCTEGVPMSREEYMAVEQYLASRLDGCDGEQRYACHSRRRVDLGDGIYTTVCRFRNMELGRCGIYPVRPLICRLMGLVAWMPCPLGKVSYVAPQEKVLSALNEYCASPRKPYEAWRAAEGSGQGG